MAGAVDWFKNTWSQLKAKFMWQLSQNCSSNHDGCLDVETVLKESPTQCSGTRQTLTWWEVSFLFTQTSQEPELSFCICLIKTCFLSYMYQFSFVSLWMTSKCEFLSLSSHSCEIPLTGNLQTQIPQSDEYSQNKAHSGSCALDIIRCEGLTKQSSKLNYETKSSYESNCEGTKSTQNPEISSVFPRYEGLDVTGLVYHRVKPILCWCKNRMIEMCWIALSMHPLCSVMHSHRYKTS